MIVFDDPYATIGYLFATLLLVISCLMQVFSVAQALILFLVIAATSLKKLA